MDAKIKELLTRLSFFAEDGMADKTIVEIAKQADALLYELVKQRNARQPMAWAVLRDGEVWRVSRFEPTKMGEVGGAVFVPLYTAPPVPRDVLMALAHEVRKTMIEVAYNSQTPHGTITREMASVDLATIADRYAIQVKPEQLPSGPVMHIPSGFAFDEVIAAANPSDLMALTQQEASEAAQPVGQDGNDALAYQEIKP